MLMRFDPFREFDRLTQALTGNIGPSVAPMDAYRHRDVIEVHLDLPGLDSSSIDVTIEQNVLTVSGERHWQPDESAEVIASERPQGRFTRELFLAESLDADHVGAKYEHGVLTITIPVSEKAKPRRIALNGQEERQAVGAGASSN